MDRLFESITLGAIKLANRFVFPPIKLGYGNPDGSVSDRQLTFYGQVAKEGPGLLILEPVPVAPEGKEHPKQLSVHHPECETELKRLADVIHLHSRLACLHLNHAGAAANPAATQNRPAAPSSMICPSSGQEAKVLTEQEIDVILAGYESAAAKAKRSNFDAIEIQAGHGYLVSQFLNSKINKRKDAYGRDPILFAEKVLSAVGKGAPGIPLIVRISGNEMSADHGISREDLLPLLKLAEDRGAAALHVGMGNVCFSPAWYFHHGSLPLKPQVDALSWLRQTTSLPLIAAGRMGRKDRAQEIIGNGLSDFIALGRPLIADPQLIEKWRKREDNRVVYCGYCLQGCLHRLKSGTPLGCNLNPAVGLPAPGPTKHPLKVLVAGGGPAGMSAALYMSQRGHQVTLAEKQDHVGGQFGLAWKVPGKNPMKAALDSLESSLRSEVPKVLTGVTVNTALARQLNPDLLIWAVGSVQNVPIIPGMEQQYRLTSIEYLAGEKKIKGPRVLVIGAGKTGLEIAERLGQEGYDVVATKRTDPLGAAMDKITKTLILKRIGEMKNVALLARTTIKSFGKSHVEIEQDGIPKTLEPFQTVVLASGMLPAEGPAEEIRAAVAKIEIIGDAGNTGDIFSATHAGYQLALQY
jgi:2,4-dienoyl-CoA reductase-like NADH-dependent reductase (Old Yellow Enzyme family)/thioredoxin reductase